MAGPTRKMSHFPPHSGERHDRTPGRRCASLGALVVVIAGALCIWAAPAGAGPTSTRLAYASGEIVPIPAAIPHEEGDMVDRRIVANLRWIAARYPIYVSDGYSGPLGSEHVGCDNCHVKGSDHYNGLAVDITPLNWSNKCDAGWAGITRLALWAEPVQNEPAPPFRWVGYDGDAGHGCGHHLHLSWEHAPAAQFQLAEWVEVFPTAGATGRPPRPGRTKPQPKVPPGPAGGISTIHSGGVSSRAGTGGPPPRSGGYGAGD